MQFGNLESMFLTDEEEAELGKWFKLGKEVQVKIRRYNSKKSRSVREMVNIKYGVNNVRGKLPAEDEEALNVEHIASGIIADWKGVKDAQGNEVPYTKEAATLALTKLPEFRDTVVQLSLELNNFLESKNKEVEGN